jgi:hypothetical protein
MLNVINKVSLLGSDIRGPVKELHWLAVGGRQVLYSSMLSTWSVLFPLNAGF